MIKLFFQLLFLADWWSSSEIRIHAPKEILEDMSHVSAVVLMNHHIGKIFKEICLYILYRTNSCHCQVLTLWKVIIVSNYYFAIIELDWLFGWMVADRCSVLGNGRVFVKKMLKYVPGMWLTILSV